MFKKEIVFIRMSISLLLVLLFLLIFKLIDSNENYVLSALHEPYQVAGQTFAHTLQVTHSQVDDNCGKDLRFEIYADKVGLIYKESAVLEYVQSNNICDGKKKINYGFISTQILIETGK